MAYEVSPEIAKEIANAKKNKKILTAVVKMARYNPDTNAQELIVDYKGVRCIIPKSEVDDTIQYRTIGHFVGTTVHFIVKSFDNTTGEAMCSRAEAQKIARPQVIEQLEKGEVMTGRIINILNYGAYIDINGVTGLMKNIDFSADATLIQEIHHVGDVLDVRMKSYSPTGKLLFEAYNKYKSPNAVNPEEIVVNQVVLGVVRSRKPFGYFVNIASGFDILASSDAECEIDVDQKVAVKILKVYKDENGNTRLRGVIKKAL